MEQEIRFCTASDGTSLAYAKVGQGPALVKVGNWMSHLEYDWISPIWQPWLENWSRFHSFYRYDPRGCGLSDWNVPDFSFDALVSDLETVVDSAGLDQFDLFSMSQGGCVSIAYAARHPERVHNLIIYGGYLRGAFLRQETPDELEEAEVQLKLLKLSWGNEDPAYRQVFTSFLIPEGTSEQFNWLNQLQLVSSSPENAMEIQRTFNLVDVRELATKTHTRTMVVHARHDVAVSFEAGRQVAAHIPGARFTILDSRNHVLMQTEPAWQYFWSEFYNFLEINTSTANINSEPTPTDQVLVGLSTRELEVLRLLAGGYNNQEISQTLYLSEKTVRNYLSNIYEKLQIKNRREAMLLTRQLGLTSKKRLL